MINLHNVTATGSFKSLLTIEDIIGWGDPVICTINPNMLDIISNYNTVKSADKKYVFGIEMNLAYGNVDQLRLMYGQAFSKYILIPKNYVGYQNLVRLTTFSYREGLYQEPRIDINILTKCREGLICLINPTESSLYYHHQYKSEIGINQDMSNLKAIFGDDLYFERAINKNIDTEFLSRMQSFGIKTVPTRITRYQTPEDYLPFKYMIAINENTTLDNVPITNKYYKQNGLENEHDVVNLYELLGKIGDLGLDKIDAKLPDLHMTNEEFTILLLKKLETLELRTQEYVDRLYYELNVILTFGYKEYFLLVDQIIKHCNDSLSGYFSAGRGSVGGCLIAYLLGITRIDPVNPYGFGMGIPFDRFLNSGRKVMPDIDMDFLPQDRTKIVEFLQQQYGQDSVKHMTTVVTFGVRSSVRDICRINGTLDYNIEKIIKSFPNDQHLELQMVKESEIYKSNIGNAQFVYAFQIAEKLEGLPRSLGIHASGIAFSHVSMESFIPFIKHNSGKEATQYDQDQLDYLGIIKLDILGVNILQIMKDTMYMIAPHKTNVEHIDWLNKIPIDDAMVYNYINTGDISGVFQWDTHSYKNVIKMIKPKNFQQLVDLNTLGRSAALLSGLTQKYKDRKDGKEGVEPLHSKLKGLMEQTYELPLYQEQIMTVFTALAGYSLAEADDVRKAIGKKIPALMEKQRLLFAERCSASGIDLSDSEEIWAIIDKFSKYTWNLGHAMAYTRICYESAYLAYYYPAQFYSSFINNATGADDVGHYISALKKRGIKIRGTDINKSDINCCVVDGEVQSGFAGIKFVGDKAIEKIIEMRKEHGILGMKELKLFPKKDVNKRCMKSLMVVGALDQILISPEDVQEFCKLIGITSAEYKESYINQYKYSGKVSAIPYHLFDDKFQQIKDLATNKEITILAYVVEVKEIYTKTGKKMAFLRIEDESGQHEITVFPDVWEKCGLVVKKGDLHMFYLSHGKGLICEFISRFESDTI